MSPQQIDLTPPIAAVGGVAGNSRSLFGSDALGRQQRRGTSQQVACRVQAIVGPDREARTQQQGSREFESQIGPIRCGRVQCSELRDRLIQCSVRRYALAEIGLLRHA